MNRFTLLLLIFLGTTTFLQASHMVGADLTYRCLGNNTYRIQLSFYRDCYGVPASNAFFVKVGSASGCGSVPNVLLHQVSAQDVTNICENTSIKTTCAGGTSMGVEQYIYEGDVVLPTRCNDWLVTFSTCCRSYAISNLQAPGQTGTYLEARINNLDVSCNSAPSFTNTPVPFLCAGTAIEYNHGAVDTEGDSLKYTLVAPRVTATSTVIFQGGRSAAQPFQTVNGLVFNQVTGQMSFTPSQQQVAATAVKIEEYRNGICIGSVMRDMQMIILNCTNSSPSLTVQQNGRALRSNTLTVCPNDTLRLNFTAQDINNADTVEVIETATAMLPGARVLISGHNPVTFSLEWSVPSQPKPSYNFLVTLKDNACPFRGISTIGFTIKTATLSLNMLDSVLCPGASNTIQLNASVPMDGTYTWTPAKGLSDAFTANPIATINRAITYTVLFQQSKGECVLEQKVNFERSNLKLQLPKVHYEHCSGDTAVLLQADLYSGKGQYKGYKTIELSTASDTLHTAGGVHKLVFKGPQGYVSRSQSTVALTFDVSGDYGDTISEFLTVYDANGQVLGTLSAQQSSTVYSDCQGYFSTNLQLSAFDWNTLIQQQKDSVVLYVVPSNSVQTSCSGKGISRLRAPKISYSKVDNGIQWSGSGLQFTANGVYAAPNGPTTITCTGSDGICQVARAVTIDCSLLAVDCNQFKGEVVEGSVQLSWELSTIEATTQFVVERSLDAVNFEPVGRVEGSVGETMYSFIDETAVAGARYYYRLKEENPFGTTTQICSIESVELPTSRGQLKIMPNPVVHTAYLYFETIQPKNSEIQVFSTAGRQISIPFTRNLREVQLDFSSVIAGVYFIRINTGEEVLQRSIIVQ